MFLILGFAVASLIGGGYYLYKVHSPEPLITPPKVMKGQLARVTINRQSQADVKGVVLLTKVNNYEGWNLSSSAEEVLNEPCFIPDDDNYCVRYAPFRPKDIGLESIIISGSNSHLDVTNYEHQFGENDYVDLEKVIITFNERYKGENRDLAEVPEE